MHIDMLVLNGNKAVMLPQCFIVWVIIPMSKIAFTKCVLGKVFRVAGRMANERPVYILKPIFMVCYGQVQLIDYLLNPIVI
jgi:hypothetical protein